MGTRNFDLGARDMKAAGRIALEEGMRSFASIDTMSDRWNLFVDYTVGDLYLLAQGVFVAPSLLRTSYITLALQSFQLTLNLGYGQAGFVGDGFQRRKCKPGGEVGV